MCLCCGYPGEGNHRSYMVCMEVWRAEAKRLAVCDAELVKANLDYLENAKFEVFRLFVEVRDRYDGSEYQQGKKDGLRIALALLGNPEFTEFNRGDSKENPK